MDDITNPRSGAELDGSDWSGRRRSDEPGLDPVSGSSDDAADVVADVVADVSGSLSISCDDCSMQCTSACDDCVVTFLVASDDDDDSLVLDLDQARVVRLLGNAGLVPDLKFRVAG